MELNVKTQTKVPTEKETRRWLMSLAMQTGVVDQLQKIFDRYDNALKGVHSNEERKVLAVSMSVEIHRLIGFANPLVVDGKEIIPGQPGWEEAMKQAKGIVKMD